MGKHIEKNGNGKVPILNNFWRWAIGFVVLSVVAYSSSQLSTHAQIADRPTRSEVAQSLIQTKKEIQERVKQDQEYIRLQLDDIKKDQRTLQEDVKEMNRNLTRYMLERKR